MIDWDMVGGTNHEIMNMEFLVRISGSGDTGIWDIAFGGGMDGVKIGISQAGITDHGGICICFPQALQISHGAWLHGSPRRQMGQAHLII